MFRKIRCVMIFAPEPESSARWWANVLDRPVHIEAKGDLVYAWLDLDGVEYGFHPADDDRNPRGGSPVIYWAVDDLNAARNRLLAAGCTPHRGPLRIDHQRQICQVTDPFGTIVGLDGP